VNRGRLADGAEPAGHRAEARRCRRRAPLRCKAGSSLVLGERPRCGRRHGREQSPQGTGEREDTPQTGRWMNTLPVHPG